MTAEEKLKSDFKSFLMVVWNHLNLPRPTPVQLLIADYLQYGPQRKVIEAFRGVGKSWITAAYVDWRLYCDPQLNILVVSASKTRADAFSIFAQKLINEMPILRHLKADPRMQRTSMVSWDVGPAQADQNPSVQSVGIYGQITGYRADEIVADDIEIPSNSDTQDAREKLAERVKEFDAIIKPLPTSRITYLGTPQTEMSLYNQLIERGYDKRVWPARYPDGKQYTCEDTYLEPAIVEYMEKNGEECRGKPVDIRFTENDLQARELSYGRSGFALQFMLDTSLSDENKYPLKVSDLIIYPCQSDMLPEKIVWAADNRYAIRDIPNYALNSDRFYAPAYVSENFDKFDVCIMAIDISGRGSDETVGTIVKSKSGRFYVASCKGFLSGYTNDTLEKLALMAKEHGVQRIIIEQNFGNGMFTELFKPVLQTIHSCSIEETTSKGQKELRLIDTLEPLFNQHRVILDPSVVESKGNVDLDKLGSEDAKDYNLVYQLTRLTRVRGALKHDDKVDSLAIALDYLKERASLDQDKIIRENEEMYQKAASEHFWSGGRNGDRFIISRLMGITPNISHRDTQYTDEAKQTVKDHPEWKIDEVRAFVMSKGRHQSLAQGPMDDGNRGAPID